MRPKQILALSALTLFTSLAYAQATPSELQLEPKLRATIEAEWRKKANKEGYVTKEAFLQSMEGHWHTFEKRHSHLGKVKPEDMPRLMMQLDGRDSSP